MGLKVAPSLFQERIELIFYPCREFVLIYIDDILIFSANIKEHVQHVNWFLDLYKEFGLVLSITKSSLCAPSTDFLGITISNGTINLQPHVLTKIAEFPNQL